LDIVLGASLDQVVKQPLGKYAPSSYLDKRVKMRRVLGGDLGHLFDDMIVAEEERPVQGQFSRLVARSAVRRSY